MPRRSGQSSSQGSGRPSKQSSSKRRKKSSSSGNDQEGPPAITVEQLQNMMNKFQHDLDDTNRRLGVIEKKRAKRGEQQDHAGSKKYSEEDKLLREIGPDLFG